MAEYNLGTAHGTVKIDSDTSGIDQANQSLETLDRKADNSGMSIDKIGNRAGLAGVAIAGGFAAAVNTAANFEQQLSGIQAVSGATASEMDLIREAALRIGQDTSFSASEAAGAMAELSKAGVSTNDILGGVADATVALAAATGIDLPSAATYASDVMNTFNLGAQDMNGIVDTLAQTANASSIDMSDLGMAFSQVGAVANLVGLSVEDTASAIGQLGDAGIKGSDAGTSLKTMLMNLQPSTEAQSKAMQDLGLITEDGTNKFFDAQGNLKSLRDVQAILNDSTKNLTAAQKQQALETIFGSDAIRAAAVLADGGAASYDAFAKKQAETGSAAEQAKIRQDNLKGSLEQLKGSLENAGIAIGTVLIPAVRGLLDFLTGLANWFLSLNQTTQQWIIGIVGGVGGLLLLGAAIIKTVSFFNSLKAAMITLRLISDGTKASFISTAATAVASWARTAASAVANAATTAAAWAASAARTVASWALMGAQATIQAVKVAAAWLVSNGTAAAAAVARTAIAVAATVAGWITIAVTSMANAVIAAAAWFIALGPIGWAIAALIAVVAFVVIFWDDIVKFFKAGAEKVSQWMQTAWNWIKEKWDGIVNAFRAAGQWISGIMDNIGQWISDAWNNIVGFFQQAGQGILNALNQAWNWVTSIWNNIIGFIRQIPGWIGGVFSAAGSWLMDAGRNILQGLWNGLTSIWGSVTGWISGIGTSIINLFGSAGSWLLSAGRNLLTGLWNGISGAASWLYNKVIGWAKGLVNSVLGFFGIGSPSKVFADIGKWLTVGLGVGIEKNADAAVDSATMVAGQVVSAMQDGLAEGASMQASIGAALTDGTLAALGGQGVSMGTRAGSAVGGLAPITGSDLMKQANAQAAAAGASKVVNIEMKTYNPIAEKASDNEARKLRAAAAVGSF